MIQNPYESPKDTSSPIVDEKRHRSTIGRWAVLLLTLIAVVGTVDLSRTGAYFTSGGLLFAGLCLPAFVISAIAYAVRPNGWWAIVAAINLALMVYLVAYWFFLLR